MLVHHRMMYRAASDHDSICLIPLDGHMLLIEIPCCQNDAPVYGASMQTRVQRASRGGHDDVWVQQLYDAGLQVASPWLINGDIEWCRRRTVIYVRERRESVLVDAMLPRHI